MIKYKLNTSNEVNSEDLSQLAKNWNIILPPLDSGVRKCLDSSASAENWSTCQVHLWNVQLSYRSIATVFASSIRCILRYKGLRRFWRKIHFTLSCQVVRSLLWSMDSISLFVISLGDRSLPLVWNRNETTTPQVPAPPTLVDFKILQNKCGWSGVFLMCDSRWYCNRNMMQWHVLNFILFVDLLSAVHAR